MGKEKIFIYGTGQRSQEMAEMLISEYDVAGFLDSDSSKWKTSVLGRDVINPDTVVRTENILILSSYEAEIKTQLKENGFTNVFGENEFFGSRQSIFIFSANRTGTVSTNRIIRRITSGVYKTVSYADIYWERGLDVANENLAKITDYVETGHIYPTRSLQGVNDSVDMQRYKFIVMLRDPRDMITSIYHAVRFTHDVQPGQDREWDKRRTEFEKVTVDEYAIKMADQYLERYYSLYMDVLQKSNSKEFCFASYALMMCDFKLWLDKLISFLGIDVSEALYESILKTEDIVKKYPDRKSFVPGRYENDFKAETIDYLDEKFKVVLQWMHACEEFSLKQRYKELYKF